MRLSLSNWYKKKRSQGCITNIMCSGEKTEG